MHRLFLHCSMLYAGRRCLLCGATQQVYLLCLLPRSYLCATSPGVVLSVATFVLVRD